MKDGNCWICGGGADEKAGNTVNFRTGNSDVDYHLVRCRGCGLVMIDPMPSDEQLRIFYGQAFYPKLSGMTAWVADLLLDERASFIQRRMIGQRVLEQGCGTGSFLQKLIRLGMDAYGIEPSKDWSLAVPADVATRVRANLDEQGGFDDGFFDMVCLWQVLEHVESPGTLLKTLHRKLRDGGGLILEVPHYGCRESAWLKDAWFGLDAPGHLWHFDRITLSLALKKSGFEVVEVVDSLWQVPWIWPTFCQTNGQRYVRSIPWNKGVPKGMRFLSPLASACVVAQSLLDRCWPESLHVLRMFALKRGDWAGI
ncbi:MAG: class I SAM-dependent methyltransferase [Verrucomicrobiae bacterium]|nr:class I SAM-dependent methyltransferase [Verrucomicrobiae bacterium]